MNNIVLLFAAIGFLVVVMLVRAIISDAVIPKIRQVMRRQSKIRCLCKHEYVAVNEWDYPLRRCYELKCRKCGKEKEITIYDRICWELSDEA